MPYLAAAIAGLAAAGYFDVRYREVPPILTYAMIAAGIGLHGHESVVTGSLLPLALSLLMAVACFLFAYMLYQRHIWAGGDVKLFTGLGALVPVVGGFYAFPFLVFGVALLATLPVTIGYVAYHLATRPGLPEKVAGMMAQGTFNTVVSPFYLVAAYTVCTLAAAPSLLSLPLAYGFYIFRRAGIFFTAFFATMAFMNDAPSFALNLGYALAVSAVFFFGIVSFRVARQHVLRERVPLRALREGDMLAGNVAGVRALARGLTREEIRRLRKAGVRSVEVRKSVPFVPALLAGLLLSVLIADMLV